LNRPAAELKTINPATEEIINQYQIMAKEQIDDKVKKARSTFQDWKTDIDKRTDFMHLPRSFEKIKNT
jgi:acyl-CoA reductase-like NAD-dependent aldehyde dehydrogenase